MTLELSSLRLTAVRPRLAQAFRWWTHELAAMVPDSLKAALFPERHELVIDVSDDEVVVSKVTSAGTVELWRVAHDQPVTQFQGASDDAARIVLRLPAAEVLTRKIRLPIAARGTLKRMVELEIERQSPVGAASVFSSYRIAGRDPDANRLDVELYMIDRERLEAARAASRRLALVPTDIAFRSDDPSVAALRIALPRTETLKDRARRFAIPGLAVLVLVLALATLAVRYAHERAYAERLASEVSEARAAAEQVAASQAELTKTAEELSSIASLRAAPLGVEALAAVARVLPDGTWIEELEIHGATIRLRGYSNAASSLIARIEQSAEFAGARFNAPIVQEADGLERFDLSFDREATP